jgi:REP element-mobilizing transposase RayT
LQELRNECLSSRDSLVQQQLARALFQETERALDKGIGSAVFANPRYADELHRSILHFHEIRYEIGAYVVMSNHCHLVMRPFGEHKLENLVGAIKSVVAVSISSETSSHGRLWFEESYDRIVRDVDHLYRVVQYIGHNPAKAGVPRQGWRRWINPDWQSAGWNFD